MTKGICADISIRSCIRQHSRANGVQYNDNCSFHTFDLFALDTSILHGIGEFEKNNLKLCYLQKNVETAEVILVIVTDF